MKPSTHPVAPEEVMALLDGELSADRAQSLSLHVEECAECRDAVASLRKTSQALAIWTVPTAPPLCTHRRPALPCLDR